jgi:hypothetical protein
LPLRFAAPRPSPGAVWLSRADWIAAALVTAVALAPLDPYARIGCAFAVALGLCLAWALRARDQGVVASGWILVDERGIARERDGAVTRLAEWGSQLGVVVLASGRRDDRDERDRGLLALTSLAATRYVPVRAAGPDDAGPARELFARSPAITDAEIQLARSDDEGALSAQDASLLLGALRARDPQSEGRIVLSDSRGAHVVLEADLLRAGDRVIDLTAPLEWRAFLFVESGGASAVASVVQATWVRQAGVEVVLVADAAREPSHPRGTRVSHPDAPPPLELRIAIERLFMAPLRSALDRAPRVSRVPASQAPAEPSARAT